MRHFICICLLSIPIFASASLAMPTNPVHNTSASSAVPGNDGSLKRFVIKSRQKEIAKSLARYYSDNGRGLCISGFVIGLVVVLGSPLFIGLIYYYGIAFFILALLLSLTGLSLSIFGLIKARGWERTRTIRTLAVIGIVLNALIALPCLLLLRVIVPQGI